MVRKMRDLLGVLQLGLEPHHVEQRAEAVVLAQLHDRISLHLRIVRVGEAEGLHGTVAQRLAPALRHHLDRQAAVEIGRRSLPIVERHLVGGEQRIDEGAVLLAGERTVDVVGAVAAAGPGLVVARLEPGDREVDGFAVHDRRDGVEEGQCRRTGERGNGFGQRRRGERAGRHDDVGPRGGRLRHLLAADLDQRMRRERGRDGAGELVPVDGERTARGQLVGVGVAHDQGAEPAHLGMQQADGILLGVVGAKRVGADELREPLGLVGGRRADRTHLMHDHGNAAAGDLPGGLGAGEAPADNVDWFRHWRSHEGKGRRGSGCGAADHQSVAYPVLRARRNDEKSGTRRVEFRGAASQQPLVGR